MESRKKRLLTCHGCTARSTLQIAPKLGRSGRVADQAVRTAAKGAFWKLDGRTRALGGIRQTVPSKKVELKGILNFYNKILRQTR